MSAGPGKVPFDRYTQRERMLTIPERWRKQYTNERGNWRTVHPVGRFEHSAEVIYQDLLRLDLRTCAPEEVDAIIGNNGWTTVRCEHCDQASYGEFFGLGSPEAEGTFFLCRPCAEHLCYTLRRGKVSR